MTAGAFTWLEFRRLERAIAWAIDVGLRFEFEPLEFAGEVSITGRPRDAGTNFLLPETISPGNYRVRVEGGGILFDGAVGELGLRRGVLPTTPEPIPDGMKDVVWWLRQRGFPTSTVDLYELRGLPVVVVPLDDPEAMVQLARELGQGLTDHGVPVGGEDVRISAVYDLAADLAIVEVLGLDDGMLIAPTSLREVAVPVEVGSERWTIAGRYRPKPYERFDVNGAMRTSDGLALDGEGAVDLLQRVPGPVLQAAAEAVWRA